MWCLISTGIECQRERRRLGGMATLIEKSKVGCIPVVWGCSECDAVFPTPFRTTTEEKGALLIEEFNQHVAKAHNKPVSSHGTNEERG